MIEHERSALATVDRLLSSSYAQTRIAEALYGVLVDGLACGPRELRTADDRDWFRGAMAVPIQEASGVAIKALAWEVTQALEHAPDGLLDRLERSRRWQELGWE
jgi:hypothetical protein